MVFLPSGRNRPFGVAGLDGNGKINPAQLPPIPSTAIDPFPDDMLDNGDATHPVNVSFSIDPTRILSDIILTVYSSAFRAYGQGAASGGGATSGSGGGQTSTNAGNHAHTVPIPNHSHAVTLKGSGGSYALTLTPAGRPAANDIGYDTVLYLDGIDTSIVCAPSSYEASAHSHQISDHTHSVPAHVHDITYGIFEYKYGSVLCYAGTKAFVNDAGLASEIVAYGVQGDPVNAFALSLSLMSLYQKGGTKGPNVIVDGSNTIYVLSLADGTKNPNGLLRIGAKVQLKYI